MEVIGHHLKQYQIVLISVILLSVVVDLVVVTSVEVEVVLVHYEQTGIMKIKVVDNHQALQRQLILDLHFQLLLVLVVLLLQVNLLQRATMVEQLRLMI